MTSLRSIPIPVPNLKNVLTWRVGFIVVTTALIMLCGYNFLATTSKSYAMAGGEVDLNAMITDKLMTYAPLVLSLFTGWLARVLKVKPEYVQAALDFANNKEVEEVERRFVSSAVGMITPLLGKYPELLLSILKSTAPYFKDHPDVLNAINALGAALVNAVFPKLPPALPEPTDVPAPVQDIPNAKVPA